MAAGGDQRPRRAAGQPAAAALFMICFCYVMFRERRGMHRMAEEHAARQRFCFICCPLPLLARNQAAQEGSTAVVRLLPAARARLLSPTAEINRQHAASHSLLRRRLQTRVAQRLIARFIRGARDSCPRNAAPSAATTVAKVMAPGSSCPERGVCPGVVCCIVQPQQRVGGMAPKRVEPALQGHVHTKHGAEVRSRNRVVRLQLLPLLSK
jgi:hypothetical protein